MYLGKHSLIKFPSIFGHEAAGIVEGVGKNVTGYKKGDLVLGGSYPAGDKFGSFWGQYSEYGVVKASEAIRVPQNISLEHAACSHMLAEALNAIRVSRTGPGNTIAIIGLGAVGVSLLAIAQHTFPDKIIAVDIAQDKLDRALDLGADAALRSDDPNCVQLLMDATNGKGVDVLFEAVGVLGTYDLAFQIIGENGIFIPFGVFEGIVELPFRKAYSKQIQMRWVRGAGNYPYEHKTIILKMMEKGLIDPKPLITSHFALAEFEDAITAIMGGKEIRVIIDI
jgi:threonine dehydrogenase-like Zn-dependent dehydrogenase